MHARLSPNIDLSLQNQLGPILTAFNKNGKIRLYQIIKLRFLFQLISLRSFIIG